MFDPRVHISTAVLVLNPRRQLLMIERGPNASHGANTWGVPGGWLDYGETPEQGALRELKEEVDVSGESGQFIDLETSTHPAPFDHIVCLYYQVPWHQHMEPVNMEPEKTSDVQWVPLEWIPQMNLFASLRNFVDSGWLKLLDV